MHGESSIFDDCCVGADMLSQILDVLDQRSRQVDYSNFGPHLLPQPQRGEEMLQNESPNPGSSTRTMVPEGAQPPRAPLQPLAQVHNSEAGLQIAPHVGSDGGGTITHQAGFEARTAQQAHDTAVT